MSGNQLPIPAPPLTEPINVLTFGPYLGEVLAAVQELQTQVQTLVQNQAALQQNGTNLLQSLQILGQQIQAVLNITVTFNDSLQNTINLLVVAIAGLSTVATAALQQQEIALLQKIWATVSTAPVSQDIDLGNVFATPTNPPAKSGP